MPERRRAPAGSSRAAGERAAKNTAVRALGEILGKLASLVLIAAMARELGQANLGIYVFAFAWAEISLMPAGMGLNRYFLRRVARDRSRMEELFDVLALKAALSVPIVGISLAAVTVLGFDDATRVAIYILTLGALLDSFGRAVFSVFNAYERGELIAISVIVQRFAAAGLGLGALALGFGVVTVAGTYTTGAAFGFGVATVLYRRRIGALRGRLTPGLWRRLTTKSLPFGAQDIFGVLLARIDAVMLSLIASQAAVGRYGAAYRLLEATFFITFSIGGAFSAMYTYLDRDTEPSIRAVFQRSIKLSLAVMAPIAMTLGVHAGPVARLFFGADFAAAADPLRLLAPVVVLMSVVVLSSSLIVSRRNPTMMVAVTGAMVAVNVGLNLALIPPFADSGAAAAMLVTEVLAVAVVFTIAARTVGGIDWVATLSAPVGASAAMSVPMLLLGGQGLIPALLAGGVVYVALFVALERIVSPVDLEFVRTLLTRRLLSRLAG